MEKGHVRNLDWATRQAIGGRRVKRSPRTRRFCFRSASVSRIEDSGSDVVTLQIDALAIGLDIGHFPLEVGELVRIDSFLFLGAPARRVAPRQDARGCACTCRRSPSDRAACPRQECRARPPVRDWRGRRRTHASEPSLRGWPCSGPTDGCVARERRRRTPPKKPQARFRGRS